MQFTRDRKRYIFSLFAFALISEIPFDLLFNGSASDLGSQNVFFTLGLGALAIVGFDYFKGKPFFQVISVLIACVTAVFLRSDYMFLGVITIVIFYIFHGVRWKQLLFTSLVYSIAVILDYMHLYTVTPSFEYIISYLTTYTFWSNVIVEMHALLAMPLLAFYHGNRGGISINGSSMPSIPPISS